MSKFASKTLIFLPSSLTASFEIVLARAVDVKRQEADVVLAYCNGENRGCVANPFKLAALCKTCVSITKMATSEFFNDESIVPLRFAEPSHKSTAQHVSEKGARSTVLTFFRQDINDINRNYLNGWFLPFVANSYKDYSRRIYNAALSVVEIHKPDVIEYFNGRIVPSMAISQVAVDRSIKYRVIEVSGFNKTFFFAENKKVHDIEYLKERMARYVPNANDSLGVEFFESRRSGQVTNDKVFTHRQKAGHFKFNDVEKKIISVFLSSTDEIEVYGDQWFTKYSRSPELFIKEMCQKLPSEYQVVVRMHPNQAGDKTGATKRIMQSISELEQCWLIKPKDKASSYELLQCSDYVVTFGSSMGIEATYWGKVSFLAGRAVWEDVGVAYKVDEPTDLINMIHASVAPKPRSNAIKVGAYHLDSLGDTRSLSYDVQTSRYYVDLKSYLPYKRRSLAYRVDQIVRKIFLD